MVFVSAWRYASTQPSTRPGACVVGHNTSLCWELFLSAAAAAAAALDTTTQIRYVLDTATGYVGRRWS